jgi:hypothetical protein
MDERTSQVEEEYNELYANLQKAANESDSKLAKVTYRRLASGVTQCGKQSTKSVYSHEMVSKLVESDDKKAYELFQLPFALWRQRHAVAAVSLMLYRWVLLKDKVGSRELKRMGPMIDALEKLMWYDAKKGSMRFYAVHEAVVQASLDQEKVDEMTNDLCKKVQSLALRFFHAYYCTHNSMRFDNASQLTPNQVHSHGLGELNSAQPTINEMAERWRCLLGSLKREASKQQGGLRRQASMFRST